MLPYIAEFLGTFWILLLGEGVLANVSLNKSGMKGAGTVHVTLAWGFAIMIPVFLFGSLSGAHFNPAFTIALAVDGSVKWSVVPGYILAQFAGAFAGACLVYIIFKDQFDATEDEKTILGVFCTIPTVDNKVQNFLCEVVTTFLLIFTLKRIIMSGVVQAGGSSILVVGIVASIGMSFGGLTGGALNPARDIAPRLAHAILPIKHKGSSNWGYSVITLFAPIVGALLAVGLYKVIPW